MPPTPFRTYRTIRGMSSQDCEQDQDHDHEDHDDGHCRRDRHRNRYRLIIVVSLVTDWVTNCDAPRAARVGGGGLQRMEVRKIREVRNITKNLRSKKHC